jgi:hypothetical protein
MKPAVAFFAGAVGCGGLVFGCCKNNSPYNKKELVEVFKILRS